MNEYKEGVLRDTKASLSLINKNIDEEEEKEDAPMIPKMTEEEIEEKIDIISSKVYTDENLFLIIVDLFPEEIPCFNLSLIYEFVRYINEKKDGWSELLMLLIKGNEANKEALLSCGIINRTIISDCPDSFEVIDMLLSGSNNETSISYFINCGGIAELIFYSNVDDFKGFISHILYIISSNPYINYDIPYTPSSIMKSLKDDAEIPRLHYIDMIGNLLKSDDRNIIINTLQAIETMFQCSSDAVNALCDYFIDSHSDSSDDNEINVLIIGILKNAFQRNYKASLSNERFIRVREIAEKIVSSEDVEVNLFVNAVDLISNFIDGNVEEIPIMDLYNDTTIIETLVDKSKSAELLGRRAIIDFFSKLIKYAPKSQINHFVELGFIGSFCEYSDTNNEVIMQQVLLSICLLLHNCFYESIPEDDIEALHELVERLDDFETSNQMIKKCIAFINEEVEKWTEED